MLLIAWASLSADTAASWSAIAFENSTKRELNSRAAAAWRQTRAIHVDMLIGNYLSHYFQELAEAIRTGAASFKRPRRTEGMRFYERGLPPAIRLRPWPLSLPRVQPQGRWDWFVFSNETARFWDSMRPLVRHVLEGSFARTGLRATVGAPVLHFRCASAPLNRHSQYHFQRYSYYRAVARRYRKRYGEPLRHLHVLTCVADDMHKPEQTQTCTAYLSDLVSFLRSELKIDVKVHMHAHTCVCMRTRTQYMSSWGVRPRARLLAHPRCLRARLADPTCLPELTRCTTARTRCSRTWRSCTTRPTSSLRARLCHYCR